MKLRRGLAILALLAVAVIPVMAQAAAPAPTYPITTMNGYLYAILSQDFGIFSNIQNAQNTGNWTWTIPPDTTATTPHSDGTWGEADLILNSKLTDYLTGQLRYYYASTGSLAATGAYPIPGLLIGKGTVDITKFFGIPVDTFDAQFEAGFYGVYDNAYSYVTFRGWEDVSVAGTSANNYSWYLMPLLGLMNNTFWVKLGWTPQVYYKELGKLYDVDNDFIIGFYGTPNLGFGTLRFEIFYDGYNTTGSGSADATSSTVFGYAGLKSVADRLDITKGVIQTNARLEIPLDKNTTIWGGAGLYYDLATYTNTAFAKALNMKWNVTGKLLLANLLDSAIAVWGNNLDILAGADTTIYLLNLGGMLPNVDLCLDVKLSFANNMYAYETFNTATGGTFTGATLTSANALSNTNLVNYALDQTLQSVDAAVRMRLLPSGAQLFFGFCLTGSYTDVNGKVWYVGTNNGGAWIANSGVQNVGEAVKYYVPGGIYPRLYIPF